MKNFMEYNFNIDKIVLACYLPPGIGSPVHKNRQTHGLAFYPSGERCFQFEEISIYVKPGEIIYLPKGSDYSVQSDEKGSCYAINFDIAETVDFKPFVFTVKNKSLFGESFKKAEAVWRSRAVGFEMKCKSELYNIIYNMQTESALGYIPKGTAEIITPAIEYIHNSYTEDNISISYLAKICSVSETYFRQIFGKIYGVSPIKYINNLKIARAKELISSGMYLVSEVASLSGFHDESYFSREFKKATGVSPKNY